MLFYLIAIIVALLDQAIKSLIALNLTVGQSLPLIGQLVKLTYVRNTGAAFSLFVGFSPYLAAINLVISFVVIYIYYRLPKNDRLTQTALAFILGGSLGNLADRLFRSYVVDYIDVGFWPVFNLADIAINLGVALLAYKLLFGGKENAANPL
ncbi:MAG: signal peptidase II [Candidatus Margulisbacteria bacterium]|nr:signal peptidase II [Candidatus Margulisiibacteriota bacterium]